MNFGTAVTTCLSKYVVFSGRARRSEYWYFALFNLLIGIAIAVVDAILGSPVLGWVVTVAFLIPSIAVGVRRLHDTGRPGGWYFIALIPLVGAIVLLVFFVQDSQHDNQYGPSPKQIGGGGNPRSHAY